MQILIFYDICYLDTMSNEDRFSDDTSGSEDLGYDAQLRKRLRLRARMTRYLDALSNEGSTKVEKVILLVVTVL